MTTTTNRLNSVLNTKKNILNIYFTAGYPNLNDTVTILNALEKSGADMIEIGMPYSDPLADGETIQKSSQKALENGMTIKLLFEQLKDIRKTVKVPLLLMGYLNPVLQFGIEDFCIKAAKIGIDGLILPDLPLQEYIENYQNLFQQHGLSNIFLITPQTSQARIKQIDEASNSFIYMVSSASTTGTKAASDNNNAYFERIDALLLNNPRLIGFGIADKQSFDNACRFAKGAIIGTAFIKMLTQSTDLEGDINKFIQNIKPTA